MLVCYGPAKSAASKVTQVLLDIVYSNAWYL